MTLLDTLLGPNRDLSAAYVTPPLANATPALASPFNTNREHFVRTTFADLWGTTYLPIDRTAGMAIGALAKPRHLLTSTVSNFPMVGMKGQDRLKDQPQICKQPEYGRARSTTILWAMDAMYWFGRVWYTIVDRYAETNRPMHIQWVPEWHAEVDESGMLVKAFGREVDQIDVIRVDGPHEGILNFAAPLIREAIAINAAAANAADNPVPSIDLHQTGGAQMTDEQIDALTARWVGARKKAGGGVGYTSQSVEARVLGQPVEQLLIAAKQASDLALTRATGFPAWAVDVSVEGSNLTYSNSPSRARELIDFSLQGYMTAYCDRFSMDDILPDGQWCRLDTTGLLQGNFKERMEGYETAIRAGVYSAEECKQIESGIALEGA